MLDIMADTSAPEVDKELLLESLRAELRKVLVILKERERNVVKEFYGIDCQERTLEEIGAKYNLTRERVRQIREKAIRKLRMSTNSQVLKTFLGS